MVNFCDYGFLGCDAFLISAGSSHFLREPLQEYDFPSSAPIQSRKYGKNFVLLRIFWGTAKGFGRYINSGAKATSASKNCMEMTGY